MFMLSASRAAARSQRLTRPLESLRKYTRYSKNDQIFLHQMAGKVEVSLSKEPGSLPIGYSPSTSITPSTFEPNDEFVKLLHKTIHLSIQNDFTYVMEAGVNALTFMPIYDFRETPRFGRTPEVDSVFGYVLVDEKGVIVPGTFESNHMYRVCNGVGLIKLSDYLLEQMKEATTA